ncbi:MULTISPECIES: NAD(+) diphosphatase [Methanobrevibacter]|uniref:NAD(+) diphosphatase n=1 Tax=Methanobrevibacter gottschalkii DSM 11977 TaxID=1122229 RepID=A0A3N5B5T1_9EURY|nr:MULTISPECIES: NAD(+) diphosphatase [Methanobrevibacter]OEC94928.1 NADH pyrophosphatase [Methanobrevibacter sp. A27]RPF50910.1 NAD+ diphosphatase [Methanobrevibacter gottschalkii DSM 11977]
MIEKSIYENYQIDFNEEMTPADDDYIFIFNHDRELYLNKDKQLANSLDDFDVNFCLYIGKYNNKKAFVANVNTSDSFYQLMEVYEFNKSLYLMGGKAVLVNDWYISHQYCGRCGTKTQIDEKDMMLKCPECGQNHYPRIAPAIIVAIRKGEELLMANHSYHETIRYALIAGFVEPGESIEEAVKREVSEEVGIEIKNLEYKRSQSWPFPNSLMVGFTAEYENGDIKVDGDEILKAKWFKKDEIIRYDSDISISDWLIQDFIDSANP